MNKETFSIKGQVVIITGGTGILGGSIAAHLLKAEAKLIILGRKIETIQQKVTELSAFGEIDGFACDVLDEVKLRATAQKIIEKYGKIDVLINVAGGNMPTATVKDDESIFDLQFSELKKAIELNLDGTVLPSLVFGEWIAKSGKGTIINISSMVTYSAITRVPAYSVAKTAVNNFTQWMAMEMAHKFGDKIRVNAIAPGFFIGDQNRAMLINPDGSLTERSKKVIAKTPMKRFGDISELNGLVQFLCSDSASFITGAIIPVDGGFSSFSGV